MLVWASAEKTSVSIQRMEESLRNLEPAGNADLLRNPGF